VAVKRIALMWFIQAFNRKENCPETQVAAGQPVQLQLAKYKLGSFL